MAGLIRLPEAESSGSLRDHVGRKLAVPQQSTSLRSDAGPGVPDSRAGGKVTCGGRAGLANNGQITGTSSICECRSNKLDRLLTILRRPRRLAWSFLCCRMRFGQLVDTSREQCNLHFRRPGVFGLATELVDDLSLTILCYRHLGPPTSAGSCSCLMLAYYLIYSQKHPSRARSDCKRKAVGRPGESSL